MLPEALPKRHSHSLILIFHPQIISYNPQVISHTAALYVYKNIFALCVADLKKWPL